MVSSSFFKHIHGVFLTFAQDIISKRKILPNREYFLKTEWEKNISVWFTLIRKRMFVCVSWSSTSIEKEKTLFETYLHDDNITHYSHQQNDVESIR